MARKQEIALYVNPDGTVGYSALGMETPEQATHRLQKEGKRYILVFEAKLLYWSRDPIEVLHESMRDNHEILKDLNGGSKKIRK